MTKIDFLLIEDDRATVQLLTTYFESQGYTCNNAGSVKKALEILENTVPSIILLDIMLPGKKGYEMIGPIKSNPSFNNVYIYFLTAVHRLQALEMGEKYGVDGVITKPFVLDDFITLFEILDKK